MNIVFKAFTEVHVALYKATGGKIGSKAFGGKVLLLTTKGRKTGKQRTVPVMYFESGGDRYVVASYGGSPTHPAWFNNMEANPDAIEVQVGPKRYRARHQVTTGEERARVWKQVVSEMNQFDGYEKKVGGKREIPVVKLVEKS